MTSTAPDDSAPLHNREFSSLEEVPDKDQTWGEWMFGSAEADIRKDQSATREVSTEEYLRIQEELLSSRKKIKGRMAQSTTAHGNAQTDLLDTFSRFRKYVLERDEVPWAREEDHTDNIAQGVITRFTGGPNADKDKWRQQHIDQNKVALSGLRKDVLKDKELLDLASGELMAQQKAFNVFLNDQGRVLQVVEKATARNSTQGNDFKRSQMYKTIVQSLEDSPAMEVLPEQERETHKKEIYQILRQLELVEGKTDELIERVLLKLKAIQCEEKDQSSQIEEQLSAQEGMNTELDELSDQIQRNNENIQEKTHTLRTDILASIQNIKSRSVVKCVMIAMFFMLLLSLAGVVAYVYFQVR